ncbi:hypothetical protein CY34DRAFT_631728 [Suillus luteus UH-Slu-Lm8-n1]|uniref:Uncharacterized protein n=1 Tax=Suillus luteus UH-Slu-Lm8-n1 TaxID=930992 RepID=A0A0D0B3G5_9AGAM|nr:hypothetical protein CY34DRAFT_631728 [Suillus luteus UH-Slu-Lm8-n1]
MSRWQHSRLTKRKLLAGCASITRRLKKEINHEGTSNLEPRVTRQLHNYMPARNGSWQGLPVIICWQLTPAIPANRVNCRLINEFGHLYRGNEVFGENMEPAARALDGWVFGMISALFGTWSSAFI